MVGQIGLANWDHYSDLQNPTMLPTAQDSIAQSQVPNSKHFYQPAIVSKSFSFLAPHYTVVLEVVGGQRVIGVDYRSCRVWRIVLGYDGLF